MRLSRRTCLAGVAMVAAGSLVLAACGGGGDDGQETTDAVINAYSTQPQNPIIPTDTNEVGGGNIVDLVFAGLVSYTDTGETEMEVAESIESDDSKVWTVKLKDGWEFSDGSPVTADSFVDAWNWGADPKNEQISAYFFYPIEGTTEDGTLKGKSKEMSGLKVVDDSTFTITLKDPAGDFPGRLGYSSYFPLPSESLDDMKAFGKKPIGNGPYKLEALENDVEARLVPNESYKGNRPAKNGGITFKFYTDTDAAFTDVQGGNLDIIDDVPASALSTYKTDDSIQAFSEPGSPNSEIIIPDSLDGFGKNKEGNLRRKAISKAINRPEIVEKIFDGARTVSTDFSSPLMPGYTDKIKGNDILKFDAAGAKKLWAQANEIKEWDSEFVISYNTDGPGNKEWVEAVVNQLNNNLELDAKPKAFPTFAEMREEVTGRTIGTAFRGGWQPDYPSIYNYLAPRYATGGSSNDGDYSNPKLDKLLAKAAVAQNDKPRFKALAEAQAVLFADLPAIPLWQTDVAGAAATGVKNVVYTWQGKPAYDKITK